MIVPTGSNAFLMNTHHSSLPALGARKAAPRREVERANGTYGKNCISGRSLSTLSSSRTEVEPRLGLYEAGSQHIGE